MRELEELLDSTDSTFITYEVLGYEYDVEVFVSDIAEAYLQGGSSEVDSYIDEAVEEDYNQRIGYSFDTDTLIEDIENRYGVEFN